MCRICWEDLGSPSVDSGTVRRAAHLMWQVYASKSGGSVLLNRLDTWELDDCSLAWCVDNAELTDIQDECVRHLLIMTEAERGSALARLIGYVK